MRVDESDRRLARACRSDRKRSRETPDLAASVRSTRGQDATLDAQRPKVGDLLGLVQQPALAATGFNQIVQDQQPLLDVTSARRRPAAPAGSTDRREYLAAMDAVQGFPDKRLGMAERLCQRQEPRFRRARFPVLPSPVLPAQEIAPEQCRCGQECRIVLAVAKSHKSCGTLTNMCAELGSGDFICQFAVKRLPIAPGHLEISWPGPQCSLDRLPSGAML